MATVQESIDVAVPVSAAYNQWTQFESFPEFMGGVESITQTSETGSHWITKIGGVEREFDTEITEQHPDERVAWKSTDGTSHAGVVTFHRLDDTNTRVTVQLDWSPEGFMEKVGSAVNADNKQVKADLERFKEFIENKGHETGGWRGDVDAPGSGAASTTAGVAASPRRVEDPLEDGPGRADPSLDDPESGGPRATSPL
ncbi:SRPBCC family protein [Arthrobacter sp. H5]|uniref:SRPBCC family protein n=1 Tax=Arthrobacter sp. H5 TaxID=1267973 RepID=UPI00048389FC